MPGKSSFHQVHDSRILAEIAMEEYGIMPIVADLIENIASGLYKSGCVHVSLQDDQLAKGDNIGVVGYFSNEIRICIPISLQYKVGNHPFG